jgi:archaellum biogenesis ATPase FlaH
MSYIFRINEDNTVSRVILGSITEEEFLKNNKDCIKVDSVPNSAFLKYVDGKIVVDEEKEREVLITRVKANCKKLLSKTDFIMLSYNPLKLSEEELKKVAEYRQSLRDAETEIPEMPEFIVDKVE